MKTVSSNHERHRSKFGRCDAFPFTVVDGACCCLCWWCLAHRGARFLPAPPLEPILNIGRALREKATELETKKQKRKMRREKKEEKNFRLPRRSLFSPSTSFPFSDPHAPNTRALSTMADVALQSRLRPLRCSPQEGDPEAGKGGGARDSSGTSSSSAGAAAASPLPPRKNKRGKAAPAVASNKKASFFSVLALCDPIDALLIFLGCLGAVCNGAALPLFSLAFGSMVDVLGPAATAGALRSEVERVAGYFLILAAGERRNR